MNFLQLVQQGVEKSNQSIAAIAEVDRIFSQINTDLKKYQDGELKLDRTVSVIAQAAAFTNVLAGIAPTDLRNDKIALSLKTDVGTFTHDVAGWKQRATGYPCIIKFDGQELSCSNADQLKSGIGELLASVGFGYAVNKLVMLSIESREKKAGKQSGLHTSDGASANKPLPVNEAGATKLVAKESTAAESSVKSPATKASTKRAVDKPSTKPRVSTSAPKRVAPKAQAKPEASQPAAKPAASKAGITES